MPLRRGRGKAVPQPDPLAACLDANGTYICTAFNPRCYIIQKVSYQTPYGNFETHQTHHTTASFYRIYKQFRQQSLCCRYLTRVTNATFANDSTLITPYCYARPCWIDINVLRLGNVQNLRRATRGLLNFPMPIKTTTK